MKKERYYVMTFEPLKTPKNKILKWLFWNIYWKIWHIWRPKILSWLYLGIAKFCEMMIKKLEKNKNG